MTRIAILVGNTEYKNLDALECCAADVDAIRELLVATENYDQLEVIQNAEADTLKARMREAVAKAKSAQEIFFYFTGHGYQHQSEFFFCASDFDSKRPNETGLSTTDLHMLLRGADAELVVKVIDACNSGTLLVKADGGVLPQKHGLRKLIQIASCLDSQSSLAGDPISAFTEKFRAAALRKPEGPVYYTDLIDSLRDEFLDNNAQTPHFVIQGDGRELFIDNAKRLDGLRARIVAALPNGERGSTETPATATQSLRDLLAVAEAKLANREVVDAFVGTFFDALIQKLSAEEFAGLYDVQVIEHSDFVEPTAHEFVIRVLSRENRPDNFVTATVTRKLRRNDPFGLSEIRAAMLALDDEQVSEVLDLQLNCTMPRAQLKITLTPKFASLKRIALVVTCAPSLDCCYVFEVGTQHALMDFGKYDDQGKELVRRWYKLEWHRNTQGVVKKIAEKLDEAVRSYLADVAARLGEEDAAT